MNIEHMLYIYDIQRYLIHNLTLLFVSICFRYVNVWKIKQIYLKPFALVHDTRSYLISETNKTTPLFLSLLNE